MNKNKALKIFHQMYDNDPFSQWLGISCIEIDEGKSILEIKIRAEMLNGFGLAHGGITYSLADSALAFAANSHGRKSVSIETSISHTKGLKEGDTIRAEAKEESLTHKIGIYRIEITNQDKDIVALFKGIVYRSSKEW